MSDTPRGIRNHNPGNIRWGDNWQGLDPNGKEKDKNFCVFTTAVWGIRALAKLLLTYYNKHNLDTVRKIINRYAPPKENQTQAYIQSVAKQIGVYPDTHINIRDKVALMFIIKAIIRHENGIMPYSDEILKQGIELAGV